ncbi:DNA-binding response regulator [Psychrobacillus glaciei]|uniref:DNA-binding response regulator n=1 Tax=Psychrobacillus glaciei TaxID=2283160 RepID=A0A5J6SS12_9BACI|nr:response regulator transcription factor [Psychrobacillus glaciei]QFG00651.1 DNA-binding response regulator [Psychrobacillus glaciei]
MKLLIVEDDRLLAESVQDMVSEWYEVRMAHNGEDGLFMAEQNVDDIILLDVMMPGLNGYEVVEAIRKKGIMTPVLMLTAKDGISDKVKGFETGADDYLVKPFHRDELLVRLQSLVRRSNNQIKINTLTFEDLLLDLTNKQASINGEQIQLNGRQFDVLEFLVKNQGTIVTKEQLFDRVWGFDSETSQTVVEVYVSHVRKKLKPFGYDENFRTFRGLGYMLNKGAPHV